MRIRALLVMSVVSMAALGLGASGASAATLFTDASHTTHVPIGATAVGTASGVRLTSGTATVNNCAHSALNIQLVRNSAHAVVGTVYGGSFNTCIHATAFTGSWTLETSATSPTMVGATNEWGATATNIRADFLGGLIHGNLTTGLKITGTTAAGTGLCVVASDAGTLTHPLTSVGRIDATYCFTGTAANWALT